MLLHLKNVLAPPTTSKVTREMLAKVKFVDGKASAGTAAASCPKTIGKLTGRRKKSAISTIW